MKITRISLICTALTVPALLAEPLKEKAPQPMTKEAMKEALAKHAAGAKKLAAEQDDLSADAQDLADEQTDPEVIDLLRQLEDIMGDATDRLEQKHTDGSTIAIETEIIEKIFEAAKKKQQKSGG